MHIFTSLVLMLCLGLPAFAKTNRPPQFVMLSFDGSKSVSFWQESRAFAAQANVDFTYFISGVYFLATADKNNYVEPRLGAGKSAIGFGGTKQEIQPRLEHLLQAIREGHEMASHGNAHYDGASYSHTMWNSEFKQFFELITNAWDHSGIVNKKPSNWSQYVTSEIVGFRAPQLGVGNGLWASMGEYNFSYDASRVDRMNYWPKKINGIWNFPLAGLTIAGSTKKTLSMDYNFYVAQSQGSPGPSSKYKEYENQMYNTYINYFNNNYNGNRAPINIGHHFSKWNGGAYWEALKRFATDVCSLPEVKCVTYKELVAFMEQNQSKITSYQNGDFDKVAAQNFTWGNVDQLIFSENLSYKTRELTDAELNELRETAHDHVKAHDETHE